MFTQNNNICCGGAGNSHVDDVVEAHVTAVKLFLRHIEEFTMTKVV